jgi:hypothetical protein
MNTLLQNNIWLLVLSIIWVLPWKGYALWTAARTRNKWWFVALLILNTFAILDIFYIFYVAKKTPKEIRTLIKRTLKI